MLGNGKQEMREKRKKLICELVEDPLYAPMKAKQLAVLMQVEPEQREEFNSILTELVNEGKLMLTKRGKYCKGDGREPLSATPKALVLWKWRAGRRIFLFLRGRQREPFMETLCL